MKSRMVLVRTGGRDNIHVKNKRIENKKKRGKMSLEYLDTEPMTRVNREKLCSLEKNWTE